MKEDMSGANEKYDSTEGEKAAPDSMKTNGVPAEMKKDDSSKPVNTEKKERSSETVHTAV